MTKLLDHLLSLRAEGRKLLVPYLMAGVPQRDSYGPALVACSEDADAVEVGLPYSDPLMDGPVIASAGERAIRDGIGPIEALELTAGLGGSAPLIAMTYYNPIYRVGERAFCARASRAGVTGLIVPDLPLEESAGIRNAAREHGLAWITLVAPTSPPHRVEAIAKTATGFVYAVSTLGVTGARDELSAVASKVVARCRDATDLPVLVGLGVSNPEQAGAAASVADGVVIGSAVVKLVLERGAEGAASFLAEVRGALDALQG